MSKPRVLYAEDDETLAFLTTDNLEQHGYEVIHCSGGDLCIKAFETAKADICILDIMMPGKDGFEVATAIRTVDTNVPIIFLSAKTLKEDRLRGLRIGGDDYLVKPFSIEELILKIEIFLKRSTKSDIPSSRLYEVGRYRFDSNNYTLEAEGGKITVTQRESDLLKLFVENKNTVLRREDILKTLWGDDDYFMGRSLDVFISRLRKILSTEQGISIDNLHGIGFRFTVK